MLEPILITLFYIGFFYSIYWGWKHQHDPVKPQGALSLAIEKLFIKFFAIPVACILGCIFVFTFPIFSLGLIFFFLCMT